MIQYAYGLLDQKVVTKEDAAALAVVEKIAAKLVDLSLRIDSSLLIPYNFDFALHGGRSGELMVAPWYSAMAQGQALSLFTRLHKLTNRQDHLDVCQQLFNSFKRIKGNGASPWVSCIDKNGNLWFEEYPLDLPCFTLNGKIFSILGVYEYCQMTADQYAGKMLQAAITTIKVNIHRFRSIGECSFYCLKHKYCNVQYPEYHDTHIEQLDMLHAITGDTFFSGMARSFEADTASQR